MQFAAVLVSLVVVQLLVVLIVAVSSAVCRGVSFIGSSAVVGCVDRGGFECSLLFAVRIII